MERERLTGWQILLLVAIMVIALYLRLTGLDWDGYHHYHPDERYIVWVGTTIEWPPAGTSFFDIEQSTLNPFFWPTAETTSGIEVPQGEPRQFAYGHLPLYLGVGFAHLISQLAPTLRPLFPADWLFTRDILNSAGLVEFRHLLVSGRLLTGLVDSGTVLLLFWLGRRAFGSAVGLLAAAFLAVTVTHIQLAHFFATDPYMTFFIVAALTCMVAAVLTPPLETFNKKRQFYFYSAAILVGLAIGSKFSAIVLALPLLLTASFIAPERLYRYLTGAALCAFLTFALTNPFALLDNSCTAITPAVNLLVVQIPTLDWGSCYWQNVGQQSLMVSGGESFPFTRQYDGTYPYLYFIEMQLRWGMGFALGTAAFLGFAWIVGKVARPLWRTWYYKQPLTQQQMAIVVLLGWCLPYFLSTGNFYVKFMRYFQPLLPFLVLFGAAVLWSLPRPRLRVALSGAVWLFTAVYAFGFSQLYQQPHPWVAASEWIYQNVRPGALIASELWDEPLPTSLTINGKYEARSQYHEVMLTWLSDMGGNDDEQKLRRNLEQVAQADYLVISSNRVYGVAPRLPEVYPLSSQFHQLLFDGRLGYELVYVQDRTPLLWGYHFYPDTFSWPQVQPPAEVASYLRTRPGWPLGRADESFTVYDQPLTMIFRNVEKQTAAEMLRNFEIR